MDLQNDKVVCKAKGKVMLGATILISLLTVFTVIVTFTDSNDTILGKVAGIGFMGMVEIITLLHYLNTSVTFYRGTIIHKNLFGKCKEYKLEDLKDEIWTKGGPEILFKKGKVGIYRYYKNYYSAWEYYDEWKKQAKSKERKNYR